jgi:hypothetical protein
LGPIFGTELHWSVDGLALAVQSCGIAECLTRVLDVEGGIRTYDAPGQGQFIELNEAQLITYAACGGMPCAVIATDLATGIVEVTK